MCQPQTQTHTHTKKKHKKLNSNLNIPHPQPPNPQLLGLSAEDSSCKFEGAHHRNFRRTLSGYKAEALRRAYDSGLQTEGAAEGSMRGWRATTSDAVRLYNAREFRFSQWFWRETGSRTRPPPVPALRKSCGILGLGFAGLGLLQLAG